MDSYWEDSVTGSSREVTESVDSYWEDRVTGSSRDYK